MTARLACRTAIFRPFEHEALEQIARLGIRWVETRVPAADALDELALRLEALGLEASVLQGECDPSRPDVAEQVRSQMGAFARLGCRRMLIRGASGGVPFDLACARLRAATQTAAEHGVTLLVETHPDLATNADVASQTIRRVGHANLRLNFDPANILFYNEGADPVDELRRVAPHVGGVHLKDTAGGYREWNFPALGDGVIDFAALFEALDAAGYDGALTLETEGVEGESRTLARIVERIKRSLDYLNSLGRTLA